LCLLLAALLFSAPPAGAQQTEISSVGIVLSADSVVAIPLRSDEDVQTEVKKAGAELAAAEKMLELLKIERATLTTRMAQHETDIEEIERDLEIAEDAELEADVTAAEKANTAAEHVTELLEMQGEINEALIARAHAEITFHATTLKALEYESKLAAKRGERLASIKVQKPGDTVYLVDTEIHRLETRVLAIIKVREEKRTDLTDRQIDVLEAKMTLLEKRGEMLGIGEVEEEVEAEEY
jgi:hypothetical protein